MRYSHVPYSYAPVSYTHLDVYKRQNLRSEIFDYCDLHYVIMIVFKFFLKSLVVLKKSKLGELLGSCY